LIPPKEWETGLKASCWHCGNLFTKKDYCSSCGYFKCPKCSKCGCDLSPETRKAMDTTFRALRPVFEKCYKCKKTTNLGKIYRMMISLEYVLDSTNQQRKRQDKKIKKAWGYSFAMKGLLIETLDYYQPTVLVYHYDNTEKVNPTWTKRARKIHALCKHAEAVNKNSSSLPKKQEEIIDASSEIDRPRKLNTVSS
jgi:hypothetical protein